mgnify:CR=1 FL=1
MIKKLLIGLAVVIVGIIIVSRFQPDGYTVERSATIAAPPEVVFEHVNNFEKWQQCLGRFGSERRVHLQRNGERRGRELPLERQQ